MSKTNKDYPTKNALMKQGLLIAIICLLTAIPAAILPWALNTINPNPVPIGVASTFTVTPALTSSGIFDVYLASDIKGDLRSTSFVPNQPICLFFNLNDPSGSNIVKAIWSVVDVDGYEPKTEIYRTEDKITTSSFAIEANKDPWEIGKYRIDLYLNGNLDETIEFEVIN